MKKNKNMISITLCLLVVLFCTASCERPEIKPENSDTPETQENASTTSPSDRLVGTWVRYYDSNKKDTLRFSKDGTFVYSLGGYLSDGSVYTDEYYYECSDNFLFYYKNPSSHGHDTHYIEFYYDNTVFTFHNFTLYPGVQLSMIYNTPFKKID